MIEASVNIYELEHPDNPAGGGVAYEMFRLGASFAEFIIGVLIVFPLRHYLQILKAIIELVSILVVDGHTLWDWAYKGFYNQPVNIMAGFLEVDAKNGMQIAASLPSADYTGSDGPNLPRFGKGVNAAAIGPQVSKVTHLIAWVAFNVFPRFNHIDSIAARGKAVYAQN